MVSRARVSGHFGEWLQGRLGPEGPVALVSLPCDAFWCEVELSKASAFTASAHPVLTSERIGQVFSLLGVPMNQSVIITGNIPAGAGLGASTAALVALIRAASPRDLANDEITHLCLQVEGATDPLMQESYDQLLWASRIGVSTQSFSPPPGFEIVGGLWGPSEKTDPEDTKFPDISDLIPLWDAATTSGSHTEIARIASESARRTNALRGPVDDPTEALAADLGAIGFVRAHTGSARGLLFKPGHAPDDVEARLTAFGYTHITRFRTGA